MLLDQLAEADIAYHWAQTRNLETKTADDHRRAAAETALLQSQQLKAQIVREEAETRSLEFRTFRDKALLILFLLLLIFILILALVNPHLLGTIGQALPWISK